MSRFLQQQQRISRSLAMVSDELDQCLDALPSNQGCPLAITFSTDSPTLTVSYMRTSVAVSLSKRYYFAVPRCKLFDLLRDKIHQRSLLSPGFEKLRVTSCHEFAEKLEKRKVAVIAAMNPALA